MEDQKGESNLNVVKNCYGLIPQSNPRLNISRVCRVKRMTCRLKAERGSSAVGPRSLREVQGVTSSTKFPDKGSLRQLSKPAASLADPIDL